MHAKLNTTNATALEHRRAAQALLVAANASGPGNSGQAFDRKRQRALDELNTTFQYHLDADRAISAALFKTDHRLIAPLHLELPNATRHLVASDRLLAEQAMADAETVRVALDDRNISYDEAAVDENITEARRAFQQGQAQPEQSRHAAIVHYRRAWTHAQRAIDIMDEAVEPTSPSRASATSLERRGPSSNSRSTCPGTTRRRCASRARSSTSGGTN